MPHLPLVFPLALLALPLVEIAVLIKVGQIVGLWPTLALLVGAALVGALLLRQQGLSALARLRADMTAGTVPARALFDTLLIGVAGVFLLIPGFLSDIVALALLLPAFRGLIYGALARRVVVVATAGTGTRPQGRRVPGPDTIDLDADDWRQR